MPEARGGGLVPSRAWPLAPDWLALASALMDGTTTGLINRDRAGIGVDVSAAGHQLQLGGGQLVRRRRDRGEAVLLLVDGGADVLGDAILHNSLLGSGNTLFRPAPSA